MINWRDVCIVFLIIILLIVLAADLLDRKELNICKSDAKEYRMQADSYALKCGELEKENADLKDKIEEMKIELKIRLNSIK